MRKRGYCFAQIWKAPAEGGNARQITRGGGCEAFEGSDGKTLYYVKGPAWPLPPGLDGIRRVGPEAGAPAAAPAIWLMG